ncbi:5'-nucleotidase C-terminal domain-containing protein [Shewanella sp. Scap07]|uniref:5'-nucleotidase C-terminal domain-containing protein n=1 Tax=Shewanella sp. Scap07 TaxID=2589987 RepID=UPI002118AC91|nr:5'-nucleotidase C-terminal domain-containing protein [Shewanella sp. Scap07]
MQPFGNFVSHVTMTGSEVQEYLAAIAVKTGGGYPQLNRVEMDVNCDAGSVEIASLGGRAFDEQQDYTFSLIHFSAAGGDDYPVINQHPNYIDTQLSDAAVFREYFVANPNIIASDYTPVEGQLRFFLGGAEVKSCAGDVK